MKPTLAALSLLCLLLAGATGPAAAASTPEALRYLSALSELAEQQAFQADYAIEGNSTAMGQPVEVAISGHVMQSNRRNRRATMDMAMTMKPDQGEPVKMTMTALVVVDGTILWTEMDNPMMGGKHVMKIGLDQLAATPDSAFRRQMSALDPVEQIAGLAGLFDFEVAKRDGGTVTLNAAVTPEGLSKMGVAPDMAADVSSFSIDIDEKTGFVDEVRIMGAKPVLVLHISGFQALDPDEIDPSQFSYTPPEGVTVTDLGVASGG